MNVPDHVYSHHDNGGEDDEGLDVEELMCNVVLDVLLQCRNKSFDYFETLDKASRYLLYKHTVLWMSLELLKLKASNGWLDRNFLALLKLLGKVIPKPNVLTTSTYLVKKIICPLTLGVEEIHSCPDHCIIY
jgi:hypothetical protein